MRAVAVALMGLPGAGKSTVAAALAARLPRVHVVSRDALRAELVPEPRYDDAEKRRLFAAVLERTAEHLARGDDVIVDGLTFARAGDRAAVAATARGRGAAAVLAVLEVPRAEARRRVQGVAHAAADRSPGLVDEVAERFEAVGADVLKLDGTRPPAESVRALAAAVAVARGADQR